ncbi:MAG TPA: glycosyltransferase family 4 protein [Solirubrobacteraceae bacterium]
MRLLIFHGYLLDGTGSNVYNARLAAALVRLGHEVHLFSQDRHPERQPFANAAGDWDAGELRIRELRATAGAGSCTVYRPAIGALLPVYVADRYEGIEARVFSELSDKQIAAYVEANVDAVSELCERVRPEVALANHLVMGPLILARGLAGRVPYAIKVHGSALEYTVKPEPGRFLEAAREGVAGAAAVLVGSHHTATSLWHALGDPELADRTRLGPPGVEVDSFVARDRPAALAGVRALAAKLEQEAEVETAESPRGEEQSAFARDPWEGARAIERLDPERERLVIYVGKLIVSKGVDLLLACWPLVLERVPEARLLVVGFGAYRAGLENLTSALGEGDLEAARGLALAGRSLEDAGAQAKPLRHLLAFLDGLEGETRESYLAAAARLGERVVFSGRLDHGELVELLPACEALIAPSTFPEAFGMVAAEAAACGVLPISAAHSGLAEVSGALAAAVPAAAAPWLSFAVDDDAVSSLAQRIAGWLEAETDLRERTRAGLVATVRERWSWDGVARGVIAAAEGRLDALPEP